MADNPQDQVLDTKDRYLEEYGFHEQENYVFKARKGLNHEIVAQISKMKGEPQWMTDFRLKALDIFYKKPMPTWGADLSGIDFDNIYYYIKPHIVHIMLDGRIVETGGPDLALHLEEKGYDWVREKHEETTNG